MQTQRSRSRSVAPVDAEAPALLCRERTLSYGELRTRVDALAAELGADRRLVLVEMGRDVASVIAYLAARRGRHPVLLVPPGESSLGDRLVEHYSPDVLLSSPSSGGVDPVVMERRSGTAHRLHPDLALLLSTSGTTGSPRLVRLSAANVAANTASIASYLGLRREDVGITSLPLHYCYGLSVLHTHLHVGASIVLTDIGVSERCFWSLVDQHGVTNIAGVPHTFALLDQLGADVLAAPSLRFLTQAGGRMAPEDVRRYAEQGARQGWDLYVMYGQTEATARIAYLPPDLAATHPASIGRAVPGGSIRIDDDGELVYRGPNVMLGYATEAEDLARGREVEELRTGDLARFNEAGLVEIIGRRSRFLKLFGHRVDLDAVERLLREHDLRGACTGDDRGLAVAAVDADPEAVRRLLTGCLRLPAGAVFVCSVPHLTLLGNGKVDYPWILRQRDAAGPVTPTTATTATTSTAVRQVLATVLDLTADQVHDRDTFVSLGGDSLTYVEAAVHLERHLAALPPRWHHLPVAELERAAPGAARRPRLDTTVLLRALGILAVVVSHASALGVRGGAHLLLAVSGFNFARFQLANVRESGRIGTLARSALRIAVPAWLFLLALGLLTATVHPATATFTATLTDLPGGRGHFRYWYVEVLLHLLLLSGALLALPPVRRAEGRGPLRFVAGVLAVALLLRFDVIALADGTHPRFQVHNVLWLFALGWAAATVTRARHRVVLSLVAAAAAHGYFDEPAAGLVVLLGFVALLWLPAVPAPAGVVRLVTVVAGGSLYTYLGHYHVLHLLRGWHPVLVIGAALATGIVATAVAARLGARRSAQRSARRVRGGLVGGAG